MKPSPHRAAAEGYLLAGNNTRWVAAKLKLPEGTVKNWARALKKSELVPDALDALDRSDLAHLGQALIRNLLGKVSASDAVAKLMQDPIWLKRQDAGAISKLFDKMDDKMIRMIEAMERANPAPRPDDV